MTTVGAPNGRGPRFLEPAEPPIAMPLVRPIRKDSNGLDDDRENSGHLFVPIAAKWLASSAIDDDEDIFCLGYIIMCLYMYQYVYVYIFVYSTYNLHTT